MNATDMHATLFGMVSVCVWASKSCVTKSSSVHLLFDSHHSHRINRMNRGDDYSSRRFCCTMACMWPYILVKSVSADVHTTDHKTQWTRNNTKRHTHTQKDNRLTAMATPNGCAWCETFVSILTIQHSDQSFHVRLLLAMIINLFLLWIFISDDARRRVITKL